jgi:hypothetical protein
VVEPVNFAVDLGSVEQVAKIVLDFEFVPKSFALFVSADGQRWQEVFSTDANVLRKVSVPVGNQLASTVKLEMRAAHSVHGTFGGHAVYGIRSLAVMAQRTRAAVDSCSAAAKTVDARDLTRRQHLLPQCTWLCIGFLACLLLFLVPGPCPPWQTQAL